MLSEERSEGASIADVEPLGGGDQAAEVSGPAESCDRQYEQGMEAGQAGDLDAECVATLLCPALRFRPQGVVADVRRVPDECGATPTGVGKRQSQKIAVYYGCMSMPEHCEIRTRHDGGERIDVNRDRFSAEAQPSNGGSEPSRAAADVDDDVGIACQDPAGHRSDDPFDRVEGTERSTARPRPDHAESLPERVAAGADLSDQPAESLSGGPRKLSGSPKKRRFRLRERAASPRCTKRGAHGDESRLAAHCPRFALVLGARHFSVYGRHCRAVRRGMSTSEVVDSRRKGLDRHSCGAVRPARRAR